MQTHRHSPGPGATAIGVLIVLYAATAALLAWAVLNPYRQQVDWPIRAVALALFVPSLFKYYLQLAIAPFYGAVERRRHADPRLPLSYAPRVSVLVPAWNEEVGIVSTLRSVVASRYPNLEVVVVNDGSTDGTDRAVRAFLAAHERRSLVPVRYLLQSNAGKSAALDRALAASTGEIVVTIDADSVVDPAAIGNMVKHFRRPQVMSVAGNVKIGNPTRAIGLLQQLEYLFGFYFKRSDTVLNSVYIVGGAAAAYRREVFETLGTWDRSIITEDIELSTRIQAAGGHIAYAPDAVVYTEGPVAVAGLLKQRLRWKYGRLLTFFRYRHLFFSGGARHSKPLTLLILPVALFAEVLLFFEIPLLVLLYTYMFVSGDFVPLLINVVMTAVVVTIQVLTDPKRRECLHLLWLAPVAWLVFYLVDAVELQALVRSLHRLVARREVTWQKWTRTGVFAGEHTPDSDLPGRRPVSALAS